MGSLRTLTLVSTTGFLKGFLAICRWALALAEMWGAGLSTSAGWTQREETFILQNKGSNSALLSVPEFAASVAQSFRVSEKQSHDVRSCSQVSRGKSPRALQRPGQIFLTHIVDPNLVQPWQEQTPVWGEI